MRTLTVLTPVAPAAAQHLPQTATNVAAATGYLASRGWRLDWLVVIDGPGRLPRFRAAENVRTVRVPFPVGAAAARNHALTMTSGEWLLPLDADDLLSAPALVDALGHLSGSSARWMVTNHGDAETRLLRSAITAPVPFVAGQLGEVWHHRWPFDAGNLVVSADAALSVGGWPALPAAEETGFLLALSEEHPGVCVPQVVYQRRTWPGARSRQPGWGEVTGDARATLAATTNAARLLRHPGRTAVHPPLT